MAIPADHSTTIKSIGRLNTAKLILRSALAYRRTMKYLISEGRLRDLFNFLYTKTLVPTGEGSGELAYYLIAGLLQRHPRLAPFPRFIEIEVTSRCNKRCVICEHTWWREPAKDLTYEDFRHLVDQFPLRWVNLTGEGDAFLNVDYLSMIKHLKSRGTSVYLVDSMDLVSTDVAMELVTAKVDGLYISIDGASRTTYESIKVGCNYDKVLHNIKNLLYVKRALRSPLPEICLRFVVNRMNVHEMKDFVALVHHLGTKEDWGDGSKIHFVGLLDFPEVHDLYVPEVPRELLPESNGDIPIIFAHTEERSNPSINRCLAWMEPYFALVPQPMVLPCCAVLMSNDRAKLQAYSFGNYTKESMIDIWNHPYYKWFRTTVTNSTAAIPQLCQGCRAYDTTEREEQYGVDYRRRDNYV